MLIGIDINKHQFWVAGIKSLEEAVIIKDSSIDHPENFTPFKIFTEDDFAYVGKVVEPLQTALPNLSVASNFLLKDTLTEDDETTAAELLALCLRKLHADIKVFDDVDIEGVVVSLPQHVTNQQKAIIQTAFYMANLPFCGCVDNSLAACNAYQIPQYGNCLVVNWQKDNIQLCLLNEQHQKQSYKTYSLISEKHLEKALLKLIVTQFEKATQKGLSITEVNLLQIEAVAKQLLQTFSDEKNKISTAICYLNKMVVELVITKATFLKAVKEYQQLLITILIEFLNEEGYELNDVTHVALVGQSNFFNPVKEVLKQSFSKQKLYCKNPEEALAKGAAIYLKSQSTLNHIDQPLLSNIEEAQLNELKEKVNATLINAGCSA